MFADPIIGTENRGTIQGYHKNHPEIGLYEMLQVNRPFGNMRPGKYHFIQIPYAKPPEKEEKKQDYH